VGRAHALVAKVAKRPGAVIVRQERSIGEVRVLTASFDLRTEDHRRFDVGGQDGRPPV
jgi:hypothetical protein